MAARTRARNVLRIATGDQAPPDAAGHHARRVRKGATEVGQLCLQAVAAIGRAGSAAVVVAVASGEVGQRHTEVGPVDAVPAMEASLGAVPETVRGAGQKGLAKVRAGAPGAAN